MSRPAWLGIPLSWQPGSSGRPPTWPSHSPAPHLPPGRRSPASLPRGAPRGIPTFRNRPGDDLPGSGNARSAFPSVILGRALRERGPTPAPADSAGHPQGNLPSAEPSLPPASGPTACLSFPLHEVGAAPRSPGERRRSCRRRRPGNPWLRNKGTLESPAAGSPRHPPAADDGARARSSNSPSRGTPPKQHPSLGGGQTASGALPPRSTSSGQGTRGGGVPATGCPARVDTPRGCCQAKPPGPGRAPKLPATCRRCRVIQALLNFPCPGGKGLTWA